MISLTKEKLCNPPLQSIELFSRNKKECFADSRKKLIWE
jgi:hypothetical protein